MLQSKHSEIVKLLDRSFELFNGHINNGGKLDYSEKEYGYLSDEIEDVQVGYLKDEDVDGSYADRLREEGFKMTEDDAYNTLKHRIESIEDELQG
jgi:hypothetical protein